MRFLLSARIFNEKTIDILKSIKVNVARGTSSLTTQEKDFDIIDLERNKDDPVAIENPFIKEKRKCLFCKYQVNPDYKNVRLLSQFQSKFTGRVYPRNITGLCRKKQALVEQEVKKAQRAGLMPYYHKEITYANDPMLFDIENPFRPHNY